MIRRILTFFTLVTLSLISGDTNAQSIQTSAKQAVIVDYETGAVLYNKNAEQRMPTSSMSKVITAYAIFEALQAGDLSLDDTYVVSEKAWRKGGSKMFVEVNKKVSIEDLLRGVIIQSGNDATIILAEGFSGSEEAFAQHLNGIAAKLGMENSNFMNASGWPDENHYSTAKDLSTLAKSLINNFPNYYPFYAEKEFTFNDITQPNRNPLLHQNIGADGIKTGHTEAGGYGLIGSGKSGGRRVIMVINGLESSAARAQESKKLMQWGLQRFKNETIITPNQSIAKAPVIMGQSETVDLVINEALHVTLPYNADKNVKITSNVNSPIIAPVAKGQEIGTVTIQIPNQPEITRTLYAANDVEELGLFARVISKAKILINGQ